MQFGNIVHRGAKCLLDDTGDDLSLIYRVVSEDLCQGQ